MPGNSGISGVSPGEIWIASSMTPPVLAAAMVPELFLLMTATGEIGAQAAIALAVAPTAVATRKLRRDVAFVRVRVI
jgi:hypothetical protein